MSVEVRASGNRVGELRQLLVKSQEQIAMALPKHLTPERMIRIALTAVQRSPKLLECDLYSIVGGVVEASQLGLEIGGVLGQAYLVPYYNKNTRKKEAQLQVGYRGYLALARRSGEVSRFAAQVVHEGDLFDYEYGSNAFLRHKPAQKDRGEITHVYAELLLKDGGYDFEVMSKEDLDRHQARYCRQESDAWRNAWDEMSRKTLIRRLAKRAPVSVELAAAAVLDERGEAAAAPGLTRMDGLAARLGVPMEPEPGELVYDRSESQEAEERVEGAFEAEERGTANG